MEIKGFISAILPKVTGVSKSSGKNWSAVDFVIETEEMYKKHICLKLFGEEKVDDFLGKYKVGDEVNTFFDIDAHEYQGRWFNSVNCWKVESLKEQPQPQKESQHEPKGVLHSEPPAAANTAAGDADDLPF